MTDFAATVRLRAALKKLGVNVIDDDRSGQSRSTYLTVEIADGEHRTIRISDHELPPTYMMVNGKADFEVDAACTVWPGWDGARHWAEVIVAIAATIGKSVPPPTAAVITELQAVRSADRDRQAQADEEQRQRDVVAAQNRVTNEALLLAAGKGHLTGQARKRALKKLRARA